MKRISFALLTVGFVLILVVTEATACVCRPPFNQNTTTLEKLKWHQSKAQGVILGKVVSAKSLWRQISRNSAEYLGTRKNIKVEQYWGAPVPNEVFLVEGLTSCDARLRDGESYLIFLYRLEGNKISTGTCSGNIEQKYATEQLNLLGKGIKPRVRKSRKR